VNLFRTIRIGAVIVAALAASAAQTSAAGTTTWNADPVHSSAQFTATHLLISHVSGTIPIKKAAIVIPDGANVPMSVSASLDPGGIDTRVADRDSDLKSAHFFDVTTYPEMSFQSTKITVIDDKSFTINGNLTMHGQTHPMTLKAQYLGRGPGFRSETRVAFTADGMVDRTQWGMTNFVPVVSAAITIHLEVEATNQ